MSSKTLMVVAGGTGGHIFPGLAVAKKMQARGWKVIWVGTADRMEADIVPAHGFDIEYINISGVRGNGLVRLLLAPFKLIKSVLQAKALIKKYNPSVVLGMGGYVAGPVGVAAKLAGIPLVIHEQNAIAGMTNKVLAKSANKVLEGFSGAFDSSVKAEHVGNPVREDIAALEVKSVGDDVNILIIGGSLGAEALNQNVPKVLEQVSQSARVSVWHQAGKGKQQAVQACYQASTSQLPSFRVNEFIDNMCEAYQWADIVICRAGALTVSEVAAAGITPIFIPLPHAVDDHQTKNASWLANKQAGFIIPQGKMAGGELSRLLMALISEPAQLSMIAENAKNLSLPNATEQVVEACEQVAS